MKKLMKKLWTEESGAETAEWLVIVALITIVAIAVYQGVLQGALSGLVTQITTLFGTIN